MNRRPKSSPFENLISVVALLPWWACVSLALVSYLLLHAFATTPLVLNGAPGQAGQAVGQAMWQAFAYAGQMVVPAACLIGGAISIARRVKRGQLIKNVGQSRAADALHEMSWAEFEWLVGEAFRLQGYDVNETGRAGADGGIDLVVRREDEKFLVQCKQWKAFKVGIAVVRELYGVMAAQGAVGGFVVTSGSYTDEAISFASGRNVKLVDGKALFGMIKAAKASLGNRPPPARLVQPVRPTFQSLKASPSPDLPLCPACTKGMTLKMARRGLNAGNQFWSCTSYPVCKGARSLSS